MFRFIQSALVFAAANLTVVCATIAETLDTHREHSASFEESVVLFLAAQIGEPPSQISIMIGDSRLRIRIALVSGYSRQINHLKI